jgi:predicted TIM-barrel fold metal-dependent hydrolase
VDAHFHVLPWMDLQELLEHMDRNGIRSAGGVGGGKHAEAVLALGSRYIRPTGMGYWLLLHRKLDTAAFEDPATPAVKEGLSAIESDLRDRGARAIGEIHVNALTSTREPAVQFKLRADSPILMALFALAGKYNRPLNIHAQWDPDTAREVERLATTNPSGRLVLSHCGSFATPSDIRGVFDRHANVSCDLSARGIPPMKGWTSAVFNERSILGNWKSLIEDYPDRFVVGLDTVRSWAEYESILYAIRFGLLANLSPETAEKVAHKNAEAWFGLE